MPGAHPVSMPPVNFAAGGEPDYAALQDPDHPNHRDAIKMLSHGDPQQHEGFIQRLKDELLHAGIPIPEG